MGRKHVALIQYANPSLIPDRLRKIALILDSNGSESLINYRISALFTGQDFPANLVSLGAVVYDKDDNIPANLFKVAPIPTFTNTPDAPAVALGDELFTNTDFSADTNWVKESGWTIAEGVAACDGTNNSGISESNIQTVGAWYQQSCDVVSVVVGGISPRDGENLVGPSATSTGNKKWVFRCLGNTKAVGFYSRSGGFNGTIDNASAKEIAFTSAGLLAYIKEATSQNGIYVVTVNPSEGAHAGIVVHADSPTAPTNCLYAYYDRTQGKAYLLKIVEGITTELKAATIPFVVDAEIMIVSNGTSHAAYYNNEIIGSIQTGLNVSGWGNHVFYFATNTTDTPGTVQNYG